MARDRYTAVYYNEEVAHAIAEFQQLFSHTPSRSSLFLSALQMALEDVPRFKSYVSMSPWSIAHEPRAKAKSQARESNETRELRTDYLRNMLTPEFLKDIIKKEMAAVMREAARSGTPGAVRTETAPRRLVPHREKVKV
jgi:hypothetical protein